MGCGAADCHRASAVITLSLSLSLSEQQGVSEACWVFLSGLSQVSFS